MQKSKFEFSCIAILSNISTCRFRNSRRCDEQRPSNTGLTYSFAIIPGVLHDDESWGDGTTEYVLEAIKCAAYRQTYNCIIHPNEPLPMILRKDLVRGLSLLTTNRSAFYFVEPSHDRSVFFTHFSIMITIN